LPIHLVPEALPALAHSRAGVVASGTATVEAALMGTPFVMVYRVTPLTHLLGRWMVRVPHFAMVNLIAGRQVVPELVQKAFTAESVSAEVRKLLADSPEREKMLDGLNEVTNQLRATSGQVHPLDQAAEATFRLMRERVSVH
jgi:lipid-A-disaccharide synthase